METLILHPSTKEQLVALKAVAKALNVHMQPEKSPYSPKFVAKIKKAEARGNYKTIEAKDIWESLGLK